MLYQTELTMFLHCGVCGEQFLYRSFSLFGLSSQEGEISCGCDGFVGRLAFRDHALRIALYCPECEDWHCYRYELSSLQASSAIAMVCRDSGRVLAYAGGREALAEALIWNTLHPPEGDVCDHQPEMARIWRMLYRAIGAAEPLCGGCGAHDLDISVSRGRLYAFCPVCGWGGEFNVSSESLQRRGLFLEEDGIRYAD